MSSVGIMISRCVVWVFIGDIGLQTSLCKDSRPISVVHDGELCAPKWLRDGELCAQKWLRDVLSGVDLVYDW
jgi:hypothetical protein